MSRAPRSRRAFLGTAISDDKPPEVGSLCRNSRSVGRTHLCSYKSVCRCLRLDLTCGVAEVCSSAMVKERGQGSRLGRNIVSSTDNAGAAIYRQGGGVLVDWFAKRSLSNAKKGDRNYYNPVGESILRHRNKIHPEGPSGGDAVVQSGS